MNDKLISHLTPKNMKNAVIRTATQIIAILLNATGQFTRVSFKSIVKPSASFKGVLIEKFTTAIVRSGINFANLTSVKDGIKNDERGEVKQLPWGTWLNFPYIIGHKDKEYVRLYPSLAPNHIPQVTYFVDGVETSKNQVLDLVTPSTAKKMTSGEKPECFTLTNTNILDVIEMVD